MFFKVDEKEQKKKIKEDIQKGFVNYVENFSDINVSYITIRKQCVNYASLKNPVISIEKYSMFKDKSNTIDQMYTKVQDSKRVMAISKKDFFTTSRQKQAILNESLISKGICDVYGLEYFKKFIRGLCTIRIKEDIKTVNENPDYSTIDYFDCVTFLYFQELRSFFTIQDVYNYPWLLLRTIRICEYYVNFIHKLNMQERFRNAYIFSKRRELKLYKNENDRLFNDVIDICDAF